MRKVDFHFFFFSSRRRHTRSYGDWSSDVCSSDLASRPKSPQCRRFLRGTRLATTGAVLSVLIADDEPYVVELVRVTLEDDRVRVFEAADGQTALAVAEALAIDLVLLDVHLPDLSGLEVCRALRANPRFASARIVMLTAAAQQDD